MIKWPQQLTQLRSGIHQINKAIMNRTTRMIDTIHIPLIDLIVESLYQKLPSAQNRSVRIGKWGTSYEEGKVSFLTNVVWKERT